MESLSSTNKNKIPWNKGKIVGQKPALKLKELWEIRIRLQIDNNIRELALFNMAIDSKLRGCDLVSLQVNNVMHGGEIVKRTVITQQKTKKPVHFEITEQTRDSVIKLINKNNLTHYDFLFKSRFKNSKHLSIRQYSLIVKKWVASIGLDPMEYGTHTI
jgi:integrase